MGPLPNKPQQHACAGNLGNGCSAKSRIMLRPVLRPTGALVRRGLAHSARRRPLPRPPSLAATRTLFSFLRRSNDSEKQPPASEPVPLLTEDNLFHPFSQSPFPAIRARGEAIKKLAPCPVCYSESCAAGAHDHSPKAVKFECPDCGWPTHCSEDHWRQDKEHQKYCQRLREANEDEHDLRSGRKMTEFELPGAR